MVWVVGRLGWLEYVPFCWEIPFIIELTKFGLRPDLVNWSRSFLSLFTVRLELTPNESGVPAGSEPPRFWVRLGRRFCLKLETLSKMLPVVVLCVLF